MALDCSPDPLDAALARKREMGQMGRVAGTTLTSGEGWRAIDFVCTCGPREPSFEERHALTSVSLVLAGTFVCRSQYGTSLLSAGSLFLGSAGEPYECSHKHGEGDRCLSFQFEPDAFEQLARDTGATRASFHRNGLPALRAFAPLAARAQAAMRHPAELEEVAYALAGAAALAADDDTSHILDATPHQQARIGELLRLLEHRFAEHHSIAVLARMAGFSPYHFLRIFKRATGLTPHQWLLRTRLRAAAQRLATSRQRITDIALDVGFEDLSNFVCSFRAEFGTSPRAYRATA